MNQKTRVSPAATVEHRAIIGGKEIDHNSSDQNWQKLQDRIDQMFGRYLRDSLDLIEHKPRHPVYLLSTSMDDRMDHPAALRAK